MNEAWSWLAEPWSLVFMQRAFVAAAIAGVICGVIGTHVVLRGLAFMGDAVSHAVFPGIALAYVLKTSLLLGGALAGIATALAIAVLSRNRRLSEDSIIGVFFAFAFGLGIVLISTQDSYTGDLSSFLFGQILGITTAKVWTILLSGIVLVAVTVVLRKEFVAVALDRELAAAVGLPVFWLDLCMYMLITLAIVVSLDAVGNILVLALLITPPATARLLTDRLGVMMMLSGSIGAVGAVAGLYLSYHLDLASGGLIVLVLTAIFLVAWLASPSYGLIGKVRRNGAEWPKVSPGG